MALGNLHCCILVYIIQNSLCAKFRFQLPKDETFLFSYHLKSLATHSYKILHGTNTLSTIFFFAMEFECRNMGKQMGISHEILKHIVIWQKQEEAGGGMIISYMSSNCYNRPCL